MRPRAGGRRTRGTAGLAGTAAIALLPALLLWPPLRTAIESRMALHMLLEFPVLVAAGACACALWRRRMRARRLRRVLAGLDWRGLASATLANCVALAWMVPAALDAALIHGEVAALKTASWWLVGWTLADGWRRLDGEALLFFTGNLGWMTGTAGLLYVEAPERLCVSYLQADQAQAGIGLVVAACVVGALGLHGALRSDASPTRPAGRSRPAPSGRRPAT